MEFDTSADASAGSGGWQLVVPTKSGAPLQLPAAAILVRTVAAHAPAAGELRGGELDCIRCLHVPPVPRRCRAWVRVA